MNLFWSSLYDRAKDRRYALLFLLSLAGVVFGLLILPEILGRAGFYDSIIAAVVSSVLAIALVCMAIRGALTRKGGRAEFPPLSSDELRAARLKLFKAGPLSNLPRGTRF